MKKRKQYGQHFLISQSIAKFIVDAAKIEDNHLIYEIGTGKGILTKLLCESAKYVVSIETDRNLYNEAKKNFSRIANLKLMCGDGFRNDEQFDIFVSNLPYSKSRTAVSWLLKKDFLQSVIMIQEDFARKLLDSGNKKRAISVLSQYGFEMKIVKKVKNSNFNPPPKVNSVIMTITQKHRLSAEIIEIVNKLFSYKRKKLQNIAKNLGITIKSEKRLEDMNNDEIITLAKKISKI